MGDMFRQRPVQEYYAADRGLQDITETSCCNAECPFPPRLSRRRRSEWAIPLAGPAWG